MTAGKSQIMSTCSAPPESSSSLVSTPFHLEMPWSFFTRRSLSFLRSSSSSLYASSRLRCSVTLGRSIQIEHNNKKQITLTPCIGYYANCKPSKHCVFFSSLLHVLELLPSYSTTEHKIETTTTKK